jgi:molecular chaperone DnaK (HSP70)
MKQVYVGIDLGTTYSAVAIFSKENGRVEVLKNGLGKETTPSVICIDNGNILIGEEAKEEQKAGNVNTVAFYKSMMGNPDYQAYLDGNEYSAEDLSGIFLTQLKKDIEETNNVQIAGAVITVPAYFNDKQRTATIHAGQRAGLNVLKIINEPTAAIIAYGLTGGKDKNVMVYDLGGGTFDVTIARVVGTSIQVTATNGNHQLGGMNWDDTLIQEVADQFYAEYGVDIRSHVDDFKELQVKCEDAKKRLSSVSSTLIPASCEGYSGKYEVTREMFDDRTQSLLNETFSLIHKCFEEITEAQKKPFDWRSIDEVVLVGGSTRMPQVKEAIVREYGRAPVTKDINVDTIVASGAAMQAELCIHSTITLTMPKAASGGGGAVSLTIHNADIQDITAHGLGMLALAADNKSYVNSIIIPKNSKVNQTFSRPYQFGGKRLEVHVFQGETNNPYDCDMLGSYEISGMSGNAKENIKVNFLYNANGIVEVNAVTASGNTLQATKMNTNETLDEIIARLEKERKEAEEQARRNARIEIMILIDSSGSMGGSPIEEAKRAAKNDFISQFNLANTYITVIEFGDQYRAHCTWSNDKRTVFNAVDDISVGNVGYGTDDPLQACLPNFSVGTHPRVAVVLTDGEWNNQSRAIAAADRAKKQGVQIYGIGIADADEEFLRKISSGTSKKIDLSQLKTAFKEVAVSIATETSNGSLH